LILEPITSLEAALERHLTAIHERDYDAFAATVSAGDVVLVTARGEVSTSREYFLQLHREWFAAPTWSLGTRLVHARVHDDVATCLIELDYRDSGPDGDIRSPSILSLVFERQDGRWLMVQDQNTPITG
jgi:uncharacterized protein (TIGR02246 family)